MIAKNVGDTIKFIKQKDYEVLNPNLGGGSFGKTLLIRDNTIDEIFVVKKYEPFDEKYKEEFYKTFVSEIKIMHSLFHENIVRIYNYYLYPDQFAGYIIMDFIDGKPIDEYMSSDEFQIFSSPDELFKQLVEAFWYLEKNKIIHRDLRPSNILVTKDDVVKIIDFGFGKSMIGTTDDHDTFNSVINRRGMELIPEEFERGLYDSETDMFCIAELFARLLKRTLVTPFKYTRVLKKMMQVKRCDRYQSFSEIKKAINEKQFSLIEIGENDKKVYQNFTNALLRTLSEYSKPPIFEWELTNIIKKIKEVISFNQMEDFIQRNEKLIEVFVKSGYRFYAGEKVAVFTIKNFFDWFEELANSDKKTILENIIHKLGKVKVKSIEDDEIPF